MKISVKSQGLVTIKICNFLIVLMGSHSYSHPNSYIQIDNDVWGLEFLLSPKYHGNPKDLDGLPL